MAVAPEESWIAAERFVFESLVEATETREGASAYLGVLPPGLIDCWSLTTGGGAGRQTWNGCYYGLTINGMIEGRYMMREDAQRISSRILNKLNDTKNFNRMRNVQWFRIADGGMPTVTRNSFTPANQRGQVRSCWDLRIDVILVYNLITEY